MESDADDAATMTPAEEQQAKDLEMIQHVMKLIGDKDNITFEVLQHVGIDMFSATCRPERPRIVANYGQTKRTTCVRVD